MAIRQSPVIRLQANPAIANTWTADQTFNDDVKISLGTGGDVDIYSEGTNLIITSSARVLIGDTANTFNDGGLTINQGANDDEIRGRDAPSWL